MPSRFALAVLVALPAAVSAAPWDQPFAGSPEEIRAAARAIPVPEGADVDVLLNEHLVSYDAQGRETYTTRMVYRLDTQNGVEQWASTQAAWSPWHQRTPKLRSRVIDAQGHVQELDQRTLSEAPEDPEYATYSDRRVLRAPLPGAAPGAIVEEQIVYADESPLFEAGLTRRIGLFLGVPVAKTHVRLEAPQSLPLRYELHAPGMTERRSTAHGLQVVEFTRGPSDGKAPEFEGDAPQDLDLVDHLYLSTGRSWADLARRYAARVDERLGKVDRRAQARAILAGARTRQEKLQRILSFVQEKVRYTGLELGEAAIIPVTPEETLKRGYGDCKDMSTLTVALLRAAGIPAKVALLRSGRGGLSEKLPGMGLLDHAIVEVPPAGREPELWLDPTASDFRVPELPWWLAGRAVVIASPTTRGLTHLPEPAPSDNRNVTERTVSFQEFGPVRVEEHRRAEGAIAADYRRTRLEPDGMQKLITGFADAFYGTKEIEGLEYTPASSPERSVEVRFVVPKAKLAETGWAEATFTPQRVLAFSWAPDALKQLPEEDGQPKSRQRELAWSYPHQAQMRFRLVPPSGFVLRGPLPEAEQVSLGPARFTSSFEAEKDGAVLVTYAFDSGRRVYSPSEVDAFRKAYHALIDERPAPEIVFQSEPQALLDQGRAKEAIAVYQRELARNPKSGVWHARFGASLLELGLGELGRAEAKKGAQAAPSEFVVHSIYGWILARDVYGRPFVKGFDRAGAIAEYRRALELSADAVATRRELAALLARNDAGEVYGKGADLPGAVEQYLYLVDKLHQQDAVPGLFGALFTLRRYDEILARAPKTAPGDYRDAAWVAAAAMKQGAPAAIALATKSFRDVDARRKALVSAGRFVMEERHYPEAASLMREGLRGNPDAQTAVLLRLLDAMKPLESVKLRPDDPRAVLVEVTRHAMEADPDFSSLLIKRLRPRPGSPEDREMLEGLMRGAGMAGLSPGMRRMVLDGVASGIELKVDGDPKTGLRVRMDASLPGASNGTTFLKEEDGALRLVGSAQLLGPVAGEAFRAAERGDLPTARRWMDWVREAADLPLLARVWTRGRQGSATEVKRAAAVVMADSVDPGDLALARKALAAWVKKAPAGLVEELRFVAGRAAVNARDAKEALAWARALLDAQPDSLRGFALQSEALRLAGDDPAEVEKAAQARLALVSEDPFALALLAHAALRRGDLATARKLGVRQVEADGNDPAGLNNAAWYAFADGAVDAQALQWGQTAVSLRQGKDKGSLNTLAALYAAQGRVPEAVKVLLQSLDDTPAQTEATLLVRGVLAEACGLDGEALRFYRSISKPARPTPDDSWAIAQRRLAGLKRVEGPALSGDQAR